MCPHVFPPHWIKGFWYNFFHPLLGLEGKPFGLKRSGEGHMGWGGTPKDTMVFRDSNYKFYINTLI